jgi:hypothetical protein
VLLFWELGPYGNKETGVSSMGALPSVQNAQRLFMDELKIWKFAGA